MQLSVTNSLATKSPSVAAELHPLKNDEHHHRAEQILNFSHDKVWWQCEQGLDHEWEADVNSRTSGGRGCPFCAGFFFFF